MPAAWPRIEEGYSAASRRRRAPLAREADIYFSTTELERIVGTVATTNERGEGAPWPARNLAGRVLGGAGAQ